MKTRVHLTAAAMALAATTGNAQQTASDGLGTVHFPISCTSAQTKFERAVALLHNFHYPETVKAFQAVIKDDPDCAIAYWGLAMSAMPNPLVPPFPPAVIKTAQEAIQQGKAAKTQSPREAEYLAAIGTFFTGYENTAYRPRAEAYEQAMQRLSEHYRDDSEARIFYALALNMAVDFDDAKFTKQLKAAAILNEEAKKNPNHPGIAHYLIHSYDFAPLAAMCVETARHYDKIAPEAPHALHMPSHIYSILGMWEDSVHSNVAARKAAEEYWAKNSPGKTALSLPHFFDFMVTADLQMAKDGEAKQLVDSSTGLSNFPYPSLAIDTALAAIPARYALDRGQWWEAAQLPVRDSQFPAAQSITYFARALGAARASDLAAARAEIGHLDEIEAKLIAAKEEYWAGQTRIQKEAAAAWLTFTDGKRDAAIAAMKVGHWLLIFFGYTYCPDLCPTALNEIAGALAQLGPLAAQVQPVFVSIDPQRDTPQALREYVQSFDARILPLSENAEQLARAADSFGVVFYKVPGPTPDEYTFAHNAIVTLVGPEGGIVTRFSSDAVVDDLARALRRLIDPAGS